MLSLGTKIACRTIGTLGMGVALYDASCSAKAAARKGSLNSTAKFLENGYFNARTIDDVSTVQNNIRQCVFNLKTDTPLPAVYGRIKGWIKGFFTNLGANLPLVLCSAFALVSKGTMAKVGATGFGLIGAYQILRQGFGIGKKNPMS